MCDLVFSSCFGKLYKGDCIGVLKMIESESVDVVFADPPFNLGKLYDSGIDDSIEESEYLKWCESWLTECFRILKNGGSLFIYNLPRWNIFLGGFLSQWMTFKHWITVEVKASLPIRGRLYPSHYSLLYYVKGKTAKTFHPDRLPISTCRHCGGDIRDYGGHKKKLNPNGLNLSDVWTDISPVRHQKYKNRSSNALPLKLLDRVICMSSDEGDTIFDPFGGSGTTYVASELNRRNWVGCDLDTTAIVNRFSSLEMDTNLLKKIHSEKNSLYADGATKNFLSD